MASAKTPQQRFREICLALPNTTETPTWGKPHFRVGDKIFAGCGDDTDPPDVGFKLEMEHAAERVAGDPRFSRAPYVGHKGWVTMSLAGKPDWTEVAALVAESYGLIAKPAAKTKAKAKPQKKSPPAAKPKAKKRSPKRPA